MILKDVLQRLGLFTNFGGNMRRVEFFKEPKFDECSTPEPSLQELLFRYYSAHFDKETASTYTDRYIEEMLKGWI